jgi:hypothetical protein
VLPKCLASFPARLRCRPSGFARGIPYRLPDFAFSLAYRLPRVFSRPAALAERFYAGAARFHTCRPSLIVPIAERQKWREQ